MSAQLDVESILESLGVENPVASSIGAADQLTLNDPHVIDLAMNNTAWLERVQGHKSEITNAAALKVARELSGAKRRTLQWLDTLGYQGIMALWRESTLGLVAVVRRFEDETGETFSASLILDFMESHDTWQIDLEDIWRTHAYLHEARWQEEADGADDMNMVSVAKAKQMSQLMFERAGTLNREKLAKTPPQSEMNAGNVINVVISKDGVNSVGVDAAQTATRQQLTAKARVRYGTSRYVNPPGLRQWQRGDLEIPEERVDDYLMLKWVPEDYSDVIPEEIAQSAEQDNDSPVQFDNDNYSLTLGDS